MKMKRGRGNVMKRSRVLLLVLTAALGTALAADPERTDVKLSGNRVLRLANTRARNYELAAQLSLNGGQTWSNALVLDAERSGLSGFSARERDDGRIEISYSKGAGAAREAFRAVVSENDLRVGRLMSADAKIMERTRPDPAWTWHDGSALPQEGRGFRDTATPYRRLPERLKAKCPAGVWHLGRQSSGILYRFRTDARRMRIRWEVKDRQLSGHNMTGAGKSGIDVYGWTEGRGWTFVSGSRPKLFVNEIDVAWTPGRPCMVYLPPYNEVVAFQIAVPKGASLESLPPRASGVAKPVVCYGTSITQGASASRPGLTWTAQAARRADVPFVNLGFAGNGKMEATMVDVVAEIDASLYVLDCLWNMDEDMVRTRFEPFLRALRRRRPDVPILCAEDCSTFRDATAKGAIVKRLVARLRAEDPARWKSLHFLPNVREMLRDGEETVDGCHPNDCGMKQLGIAFGDMFREILLK